MHPVQRLVVKAKSDPKRIALPELSDLRTIQAARAATDEGIAHVVLVGNPELAQRLAQQNGVNLDGIEIVNHMASPHFEEYAHCYYEMRKSKGETLDSARKVLSSPLFFGAMMAKQGKVDGMVAGAVNTTADVMRASIRIVGMARGVRTVSSCFLMVVPDCPFGSAGSFIYADCAVVPTPDADQLADIAMAGATSCRDLLDVEPIIAFLSFSTHGSAKDKSLDRIIEATRILRERDPELIVDGEMQADAALVPAIGQRKCPGSPVAGMANTLIFPDLNAGNIAYKLTERLAKADACGPLLQGLALPISDLSRGCSVQDIVNTIAIMVVKSQSLAAAGSSPAS